MLEDRQHALWISTNDLRSFCDRFPRDAALLEPCWRTMVYAREHKKYYLASASMKSLLRSNSHRTPFQTEVLKFLDWYQRNIEQVAINKRTNLQWADAAQQQLQSGNAYAPDTEPGDLPQPREQPRIPGRWPFADAALATLNSAVCNYWQGKYGLALTFGAGFLLLALPRSFMRLALPLDWTSHYHRVMWAFAAVACIATACALAYAVALTRSFWRHGHRGSLKGLFALFFYLLTLPLAPLTATAWYDPDMLHYWWASVTGRYHPAQVYADEHLGRIVLRGPMDLGSAQALQGVLDSAPYFTLLQIESPGGFVVEGLRMAQLAQQHQLDTVSLEQCASSCTLVLASGQARYLGPQSRIGFHRSGMIGSFEDRGWTDTDSQIADVYRRQGATEAFIAKALHEPMFRIWWAPHEEMLSAGFANSDWAQRKAGY